MPQWRATGDLRCRSLAAESSDSEKPIETRRAEYLEWIRRALWQTGTVDGSKRRTPLGAQSWATGSESRCCEGE